jgi:hypothetical protein
MSTMQVTTRCPMCQKSETLEVDRKGYHAWRTGTLIQRALPKLSATQREQLLTGIDDACFKTL